MRVQIEDYPQLSKVCWNMPGIKTLTGEQALAIYEDRWRHVDEAALNDDEQALIDRLVREHGGGRLCV